jgi:hypothetical protein
MRIVSVVGARILRAELSSDLSEKLEDADIDILRAVGMAGVRHALGGHMLRALHSSGGRRQAVEELRETLGRKFPLLDSPSILAAALGAVHFWLSPACPACDGLGYAVIPDTTTLGDKPCGECQGDGRARIGMPKKATPAYEWAGAEIEQEVERFERAVARKLHRIHGGVERSYALRRSPSASAAGPGSERVLPAEAVE